MRQRAGRVERRETVGKVAPLSPQQRRWQMRRPCFCGLTAGGKHTARFPVALLQPANACPVLKDEIGVLCSCDSKHPSRKDILPDAFHS